MCRLEFFDQPVNNFLVPVVTAQVRVAVCALNFKNSVTDFENADVESTATQVEHENCFVFAALVETVSQCSCSWFVDNSQNFEARDLTGFFCCGALSVVEICRHGDDCLRY